VAVIVFVLLRVVPGDPIAMMIRRAQRLPTLTGCGRSMPRSIDPAQFITWLGRRSAVISDVRSAYGRAYSSWCWRGCRRRSNWRRWQQRSR